VIAVQHRLENSEEPSNKECSFDPKVNPYIYLAA